MKSINKRRLRTVRNISFDVVFDIIGGALYAAGIYSFISAANFAPGGIAGLSIILNHYLKIPIGVGMLLFNIPVSLLTLKFLGKKFFFASIKSMVIVSLLTDLVFPLLPVYTGEPLLAALFGGLLSGIGLALIYSRNSSTGGTDFIIMSLRKKIPQFSIGTLSLVIDGVVILLGGFVFGYIEAVLYGVIVTIVCAATIDIVTNGFGAKRMVIIISDKADDVVKGIYDCIDRGVTSIDAKGTYTNKTKNVLLCTCSKTEAFSVKRLVSQIDKSALVFFCTVEEAYGFGFKDLKS